MEKNVSPASFAELKKLFQNSKNIYKPYIYLPIDGKNGLDTPEKLTKLIAGYKKSCFGGIIPFSYKNFSVVPMSKQYYDIYNHVKQEAQNNSLALGYLDDTYLMREYLNQLEEHKADAACKVLVKYEYTCTEGQQMKRKLHALDTRLSLVAVNDDDLTILDLREYVQEDGETLDWTVPDGNWNIEEYTCEPDLDANYINLMDYDVSLEYLKRTFRELIDRLSTGEDESPIDVFIYRNVMYAGRNRRMWHMNFNKTFEEQYGLDPAPYYPLLFRDFGGYAKRYKCMMMTCRAKMLTEGYLKAVADFCRARNIFCTGFPAEGKATACSWLFGDGQMLHKYATAPGISMPFAYLYGLNGVRVASGAADGMGAETVTADMFKYFQTLSRDIIYRESMNAYVRGVNMLFAHLGEDRTDDGLKTEEENEGFIWGSIFSKSDDLADFAEFVTRAQTMLRGGEHVSEVAIMYPIYTLHSGIYLYHAEQAPEFEYPVTPDNADYMEVMNNFLNYVGIDATFVHPDIITGHAFAENGTLFVSNDKTTTKYKLLVLPSMSIVSIKTLRIVKKFFDEGGKIIATNNLPRAACECSRSFDNPNTAIRTESEEDREVWETMEHIFGKEISDTRTYQRYYKNTNDNDGMAYFFPSSRTSADRTESVDANLLYQAVGKFEFAPDIYIERMPRREFLGIINYNLPDFLKVEIDKRLARGCSMNYIHKKYAGCDIYYITNTTSDEYKGSILLRGRHTPEEWNPYTGKVKRISSEYVLFRGEVYTKTEMSIDASSCVFVVSQTGRPQKDIVRDLTGEELIQEFYPAERF